MTTGERIDPRDLELTEKVVYINRVSKVVKGGRRFSFSALVVVGDGHGHVGAGMGKANEVPEAIRKGASIARKGLIRIPMNANTITHPVLARFGAAKIMMKPASAGTGVIAGGGVRAVMEVAGVKDILAKSLGSSNAINVVRATIQGLMELKNVADERRRRVEAAEAPIEDVIRRGRPPVVRVPRDRDRDGGPRRGPRDDRPRPPFEQRFEPRSEQGQPGVQAPMAPAVPAPEPGERQLPPAPAEMQPVAEIAAPEPVRELAPPETAVIEEAGKVEQGPVAAEAASAAAESGSAPAETEAVAPAPAKRKRAVAVSKAVALVEAESAPAQAEKEPAPTRTRATRAKAPATGGSEPESEASGSSGAEPEGTVTQPEATAEPAPAAAEATGEETAPKPRARRTRKIDAVSSAEESSEKPPEGSIESEG